MSPVMSSPEERPPLETAVAARLLEMLDRQGVPHCVLGDTRRIATAIPGDLDIMVDPATLKTFPALVTRFAAEHGLDLVQCWQHEVTCFSYVLSWRNGAGSRAVLIADVCGDFLRNGRLFLAARELLPERRRARSEDGHDHGFFVPAPRHAFVYYLLKKVAKQELSDDHTEYLGALWRRDPEGATAEIERFWKRGHAAALTAALWTGHWQEVRRRLPELRSGLYLRLSRSFLLTCRELRRRAHRVVRPSGLQVVLLGPDGSGKSSVIDALLREGVPGYRRVHSVHFRPGLGGGGDGRPSGAPHPQPHGKPPRGLLASTAKLLYYGGDYLAGHVLGTRPRLVRSTLVLFDRYYDDLLVDPRRYRYGGGLSVARWIGRLVPKPGLVILLDAPTDAVRARKQEVTPAESERQRKGYLTLLRELPQGRVVDASQPLALVVAEVRDLIVKRAAELTRARLGIEGPADRLAAPAGAVGRWSHPAA